ncbi:MAG: nucleotide exchange factor GrpE [Treponema sp.]|jgi:molecular chaperone GrpE|nr:nucleotide exchange factor GrpE [Treponema sp.]
MSKHHSHEEKHKEEQAADGSHVSAEQKHEDQVNADSLNTDSSGASESEPNQAETPLEKINALEAQVAELKDQYLRKAADFENFRKRMNQEKASAIDFANQSLLLDLIPVIDDFERAIKSADDSEDFASFHEGVSMIEKRLINDLSNKWGLKRYESANQLFNPEIHEAIMMDKSPDVSEPTVSEDFLKGYMLKDRVVRAAKVKVLMPLDKASGESTDSEAK